MWKDEAVFDISSNLGASQHLLLISIPVYFKGMAASLLLGASLLSTVSLKSGNNCNIVGIAKNIILDLLVSFVCETFYFIIFRNAIHRSGKYVWP
jgi:hypothetical protein